MRYIYIYTHTISINTIICYYPCNLLECVPLRVIKADLLFDNVGRHQTPVNLQVDGHQKQTLRKQIHLRKKDGVKATQIAFTSFLSYSQSCLIT